MDMINWEERFLLKDKECGVVVKELFEAKEERDEAEKAVAELMEKYYGLELESNLFVEILDDVKDYLVEMNNIDGVAYNRAIIISRINQALKGGE